MRIAVLQFSPAIGTPPANAARADTLLAGSDLSGIELLVLPELALTGYNFASRAHISPYLEPTAAGFSAHWAARTAARLGCCVTIGYPELEAGAVPRTVSDTHAVPTGAAFNSCVTVDPQGAVLAHYRKTHLYYTDATWAEPGPGFSSAVVCGAETAFAICMDLNPQFFSAAWTAYEAATYAAAAGADVLVACMAWLSKEGESAEPDIDTLGYWIERLTPLLQAERSTVVVVANRAGVEQGECRACELDPAKRRRGDEQAETAPGKRDDGVDDAPGSELQTPAGGWLPGCGPVVSDKAVYAGTSCVMRLGGGRAKVFGLMGRAAEGVLVVDTDDEPLAVYQLAKSSDV